MKLKAKLTTALLAMAITCSSGIALASNYTVTNAEPKSVFFYMNETEKTFYKPNAYHVLFFVTQESNKLFIADGESRYVFMQLKPYEDAGVSYDVTELPVSEPNSGLFAISATAGAHAQNLGYWLVGVSDHKWKILLDYSTLAKNGFEPDEWNRLYGKYDDYNKAFTITITTEYMPPWGETSVDLVNMPKHAWACKWNDAKNAMELKKADVEKPAFIDEQWKAMVYMEHYLKQHPKFKALMNAPGAQLSYSRHNPNPDDGLENHEIKILEDTPNKISTKATFIINEIASILYFDEAKGKFVKIK